MEARLVAYAIPMFIVLIGIELLVARVRGVRVARFADAITDLGCGIASRIFHLFDTALLVGVYSAVFAAAAPWQLPTDSAATWIGAFVGVDLLVGAGERLLGGAVRRSLDFGSIVCVAFSQLRQLVVDGCRAGR